MQTLLLQIQPEQQMLGLLAQLPPLETHPVAACAGSGATIETTAGMATAAATPNARTTSRRFMPATVWGINDSSLSR